MGSDRLSHSDSVGKPLVVWAGAKALVHLGIVSASRLRPLTALEQNVAIWPIAVPVNLWFERVLFAPFERWDVAFYSRIVVQGYSRLDGTMQFHPLYPLSAIPLTRLGITPLPALMLAAGVAAILLTLVFGKLARQELGPGDAQFAVLAFLLSPAAFALHLPYPEALFLLWAVLTLYWARSGRWALAGLAGALATLTRQQGLLLVLPLVWIIWQDVRNASAIVGAGQRVVRHVVTRAVSLSAIPLAYGGWILYRAVVFDDVRRNVRHPQEFIYSILISPSADKVVPTQMFLWPWEALARAVERAVAAPDVDIVVNLVGGLGFLVLLGLAWRGLDPSYRIYTLATTCISFAYHTGTLHPYMGLLRHLLLGFPVFLGIASRTQKSWQRAGLVGFGILSQSFLLLLYALEAWVP